MRYNFAIDLIVYFISTKQSLLASFISEFHVPPVILVHEIMLDFKS